MTSTAPPTEEPAFAGASNEVTTDYKVVTKERTDVANILIRCTAEFIGTFFLVLAGVGTAFFATRFYGVGWLSPLAFGLAVIAGGTALGHVSGGHFNPAITLGAAAAGRLRWLLVGPYILAQFIGGVLAGGFLWLIIRELSYTDPSTGTVQTYNTRDQFAGLANHFGSLNTGGYEVSLIVALLVETVFTAVLVYVALGSTDRRAKANAPVAIGMTLAIGLLLAQPITNGSMNPARSFAVLPFATSDQWSQLWVFILAPVVGGLLAGLLYPVISGWDRAVATELAEEYAEIELLDQSQEAAAAGDVVGATAAYEAAAAIEETRTTSAHSPDLDGDGTLPPTETATDIEKDETSDGERPAKDDPSDGERPAEG